METSLKDIRENKGYTQKSIAGAIEVSRSAYAKWENGLCFPPALKIVELSEIFEVPEREIIKLIEKKAKCTK